MLRKNYDLESTLFGICAAIEELAKITLRYEDRAGLLELLPYKSLEDASTYEIDDSYDTADDWRR